MLSNIRDIIISKLLINQLPLFSDYIVKSIEPNYSISLDSIIHWENWSDESSYDYSHKLKGWTNQYGHYSQIFSSEQWLQNFCSKNTFTWTTDIQKISAISASKSNLADFATFGEMVRTNSQELVRELSHEMLNINLAHPGIRILSKNSLDFFESYSWSNRISLINCDGSHHFAAAHFIAEKLRKLVPLTGKMYKYTLDPQCIINLCSTFHIYAISDLNPLHNYLEKYNITYFYHTLPRPLNKLYAIFLPKAEILPRKIATLLETGRHFNLGLYFADLIKAV